MSITFWIPDAPTVEVERECWLCDGNGISPRTDDGAPCPECGGSGKMIAKQSTMPELNMASVNAREFLDLLDPAKSDSCGTWSPEECVKIAPKLIRLQNGVRTEQFEVPAEQVRNFHYCGRDETYVRSRAGALLAVVVAAAQSNLSVCWA